ncbi:hypothetical protein [Novosphingobium sp.]|jgi:hypothetical protein|uniref:hypothetical protein n=1 Tax=Novosphingobium sp. TaxID=1874826 RepID=UPI002FDD7C54
MSVSHTPRLRRQAPVIASATARLPHPSWRQDPGPRDGLAKPTSAEDFFARLGL